MLDGLILISCGFIVFYCVAGSIFLNPESDESTRKQLEEKRKWERDMRIKESKRRSEELLAVMKRPSVIVTPPLILFPRLTSKKKRKNILRSRPRN